MKILLISPCSSYWQSQFVLCEPMGLAYIGAAVREAGHEVRIVQQLTPDDPPDDSIVDLVRSFAPDIIGVSVLSDSYPISLDLVRRIRKVSQALVVYGGKHASIHPEIALEEEVDVVVAGEGEEAFCEILDRYDGTVGSLRTIGGLAFDDGLLHYNGIRKRIEDLDSIPFPMRDGLPMGRYRMVNVFAVPASRQRHASCVGSRGCVFNCLFCPTPVLSLRRWITRSAESVIAEIEELVRRFNINYLLFHDEDVLLNRDKAFILCERMIEKGFSKRLKWGCETNISNMDEEFLDVLARSGCVFLSFGIESGLEESLKKIHKNVDLMRARDTMARARRRMIQTNANIIIGFPWENSERIMRGFNVLKTMQVDTLAINVLNPIKGTALWDIAMNEGLVVDPDYHNWHHKRAVLNTRHISADEVDRLYRLLNRRYYFRIRYILSLLLFGLRRPVCFWGMAEIFWYSVKGRLHQF